MRPREGVLLSYQKRWVEDPARLKLAEKARQVGWSWSTAYRLVKETGRRGAKWDAWVSSRDGLQARLLIEDCKTFVPLFKRGADYFGQQIIDERQNAAYVLQFANGHRIHSLSSQADAQAGKRGTRVLDEFALHPDPRRLYAIAYPGITWGGNLEIFSTHRGRQNFFCELTNEVKHQGNPKGFSLHRVTLQDALEAGLLSKLQAKLPGSDPRREMDEADYYNFIRRGCADEESFQEEFCCNPSSDEGAFLSYELISSCEYGVDGTEGWAGEGPLYAGVDIGRVHDLTVIWVLGKLGDVYHTVDVMVLERQSFEEQEAALDEVLQRPGLKRCCIDQTGLGRQFVERAKKRFGWRVEGITFTAGAKEELAYPVRAALEDRTIRLPKDKWVRADLRSIRKQVTSCGNIRFSGERTANGHADRFWALALALRAAKNVGQFSAALC